MATNLKQFEKWWKATAWEGTWDYEDHARNGWQAALEMVLLLGSDDDVLYNKIKDELYG